MRTRSKGAPKAASKAAASKTTDANSAASTRSLPPSDENPPKVFILPKPTLPEARIVTLANPATSALNRYYFCPEKGFYEFTKVAAPKKTPRSWLITPCDAEEGNETSPEDKKISKEAGSSKSSEETTNRSDKEADPSQGYVMSNADMFIASPFDLLFLVLPALYPTTAESKGHKQMFLSLEDHIDAINTLSDKSHMKYLLKQERLQKMLEQRMSIVCDTVDAGDEKMYRISGEKLAKEILGKAQRMSASGLPASMEEKFIKSALEAPVMSIKREESSISAVSIVESADSQTTAEASTESQETVQSTSTEITSVSVTNTVTESKPTPTPAGASESIKQLLRLRTALNFICGSYLPPHLRKHVMETVKTTKIVDFAPLEEHLAGLASMRAHALALRSISDNINRKRGIEDEEAALDRADKKRKKEEEEKKRKNESRGVKELKKVDTSGMKKLSSFFTKAPAKK